MDLKFSITTGLKQQHHSAASGHDRFTQRGQDYTEIAELAASSLDEAALVIGVNSKVGDHATKTQKYQGEKLV